MFGRALLRRCVVCGGRKVFRRWLQMSRECPTCGLVFERQEGHFVGAVGINTILTFGALAVTLVVGIILTAPDLAVVPILVCGGLIAVLLPIVAHPTSRMLWTAIDLLMRPLEPGEAPRLDRQG
jgi:uncharacterized protein (DUF983 family)